MSRITDSSSVSRITDSSPVSRITDSSTMSRITDSSSMSHITDFSSMSRITGSNSKITENRLSVAQSKLIYLQNIPPSKLHISVFASHMNQKKKNCYKNKSITVNAFN